MPPASVSQAWHSVEAYRSGWAARKIGGWRKRDQTWMSVRLGGVAVQRAMTEGQLLLGPDMIYGMLSCGEGYWYQQKV
jgi:hypothetical protein